MTLRARIVLLIAAVAAATGIAFSVFGARVVRAVVEGQLEAQARVLSATSSDLIAHQAIDHAGLEARDALLRMKEHAPALEFAYVVGLDGDLLAHTFAGGLPRALAQGIARLDPEGSSRVARYRLGGATVIEVCSPIVQGLRGYLCLGLGAQEAEVRATQARSDVVLFTILVALLGTLAGVLVAGAISRPLALLADSLRAYGRGGGERVEVRGGGRETEELIGAFNGMLADRSALVREQGRLEAQLRQAQKMEAVGLLAGGLAHDFNNILTAIMGHASALQEALPPGDPRREDVDVVLASAERAAGLTRGLLAFSRKRPLEPRPVDLDEIVRRIEALLARLIGEDVALRLSLSAAGLTVSADPGQIEQVLMNLAVNARDAMPGGGTLTIESARVLIDEGFVRSHGFGTPGAFARLTLTDTGTGMDEATRERIFEPFFTTKEVGKGTGLGLSIVYAIVSRHGGHVNVYSEPGAGSSFRIYLPLVAGDPAADPAGRVAGPPPGGDEVILLAEDDASVRGLIQNVLEGAGYTVIVAADGEEAIGRFREHRDRIQLLLSDVIMPRKNGREVLDAVRAGKPSIKVLFMSGYTHDVVEQRGILGPATALVYKPIAPNELLRRVRDALDGGTTPGGA